MSVYYDKLYYDKFFLTSMMEGQEGQHVFRTLRVFVMVARWCENYPNFISFMFSYIVIEYYYE
jgi:hypothetical protein